MRAAEHSHNGPGTLPIVIMLVVMVAVVALFLWMARGYEGRWPS